MKKYTIWPTSVSIVAHSSDCQPKIYFSSMGYMAEDSLKGEGESDRLDRAFANSHEQNSKYSKAHHSCTASIQEIVSGWYCLC